ncbi:hypothetical protein J437_LFUL012364, partial [Ladona fulva]
MSKNLYLILRKTSEKHGHKLYPNYNRVRLAKNAAYPEGISVSEEKCEVELSALLTHTASRIITTLSLQISGKAVSSCTLMCKYGFDGSSGHSQYKQKWHQDGKTDESTFMSSLVPLRLIDDNSAFSDLVPLCVVENFRLDPKIFYSLP